MGTPRIRDRPMYVYVSHANKDGPKANIIFTEYVFQYIRKCQPNILKIQNLIQVSYWYIFFGIRIK